MKKVAHSLGLALSVTLVSIFLASCGNPQEKARKELAGLNKEYSTEAFIDSAAKGDLMAIMLYLQAGMKVNAETDGGNTALMAAVSNSHKEIVKFLLEHGANPGISLEEGRLKGVTPLMLAANLGQLEVVRLFLGKGANPNASDDEGYTPLMFAVKEGHLKVVQELLPQTKDLNATNKAGETVGDLALTQTNLTILGVLQKAGVTLISEKFFQQMLKELAKDIEFGVVQGCKSKDKEKIREAVFGQLARLKRVGVSDAQMSLARERARKAILDGMYTFNLQARFSARTDEDREMDTWEKAAFDELDAQLKQVGEEASLARGDVQ
jgi:Ankyrin repeats (3 copies)